MNDLLKIIKHEKLSSDSLDISDENLELIFKYIDLNIVQHWVDHNYSFVFKDYAQVKNFFTIEKNQRVLGCTSLQSPNWTLLSPVDYNAVVFDQSKYLQLLKLSVFL